MANIPKFRPVLLAGLSAALLWACGGADFRYLDGGEGRLAELDGRWVVVNFWAEWCKPCRAEMPALSEAQRLHPDWVVLGVNYDGAPDADLRRVREHYRLGYRLLSSEPAPRLGLALPGSLPATWLRDPEGRWFGPLMGEQTVASLEAALRKSTGEEQR